MAPPALGRRLRPRIKVRKATESALPFRGSLRSAFPFRAIFPLDGWIRRRTKGPFYRKAEKVRTSRPTAQQ